MLMVLFMYNLHVFCLTKYLSYFLLTRPCILQCTACIFVQNGDCTIQGRTITNTTNIFFLSPLVMHMYSGAATGFQRIVHLVKIFAFDTYQKCQMCCFYQDVQYAENLSKIYFETKLNCIKYQNYF